MKKVKLHLEDKGQDFLWFVVEVNKTVSTFGKIIKTGPFQGKIWNGKRICNFDKVGQKPKIEVAPYDLRTLNYAIEKIEEL